MKLLLDTHADTHALLWWLDDDARLDRSAADAIAEADFVAVSAASSWKIAIKQAIGVLSGPDDLSAEFATNGNRLVDHGIAHLRA